MEEQTGSHFNDETPVVTYEVKFSKHPSHKAVEDWPKKPFKRLASPSQEDGNTSVDLVKSKQWDSHIAEADKTDMIVAACSGVLTGALDVLFVRELSLDRANEWGKERIQRVVMEVANIEGYSGNDLNAAIRTLEKNHPFASDGNTNDFGGGLQHHLRDFAHHFSIGGLFFSLLTQFTGMAFGTDRAGNLIVEPIPDTHKGFLGKNIQEKIAFGTIGWLFHMVSDMAGSSGSLMGGAGIPGPIVSLMKELSALPFFKESGTDEMSFRLWVTKLFNGTLLADHDEAGRIIKGTQRRFDLRTEIGLINEIGRQSLPVLLNQCIVRGFYFCRRLFMEIRDLDIRNLAELDRIAPEDVLPWSSPAVRRMATISSGVFTAVDVADATIRAIEEGDVGTFFLHVNYAGMVTFIVASVGDARSTIDNRRLEGELGLEAAYEQRLSNLNCLQLSFQQTQVLHSLILLSFAHDLNHEKHDKRAQKKKAWLNEWRAGIERTIENAWATEGEYFLDEEQLYQRIDVLLKRSADASWLWLVAMEATQFKPYAPLYGGNDQNYKGLKLAANYLSEVFCERQDVVSAEQLDKLDKAVNKAKSRLERNHAKRVLGITGTVAIVVATGGIAFNFAPAIAPVLAPFLGFSSTSLSGAALTSASLAFLGGGSLAVGGAGMAGGAAVIAGGGALLGAAGGTGITAAVSMSLATNSDYVLSECAKLIAFTKEVLVKRFNDFESAYEIHAALNERLIQYELNTEAIKRDMSDKKKKHEDGNGDSSNLEAGLTQKQMVRVLKRSLKYLKHSNKELAEFLQKEKDKKQALRDQVIIDTTL